MPIQHHHVYTTWQIGEHPHPEKCFDWVRDNWYDLYASEDEQRQALEGFADHFSLTRLNWEVSPYAHSYCTAQMPEYEEVSEQSGPLGLTEVWLYTYLQRERRLVYWCRHTKKHRPLLEGNCPFTGTCFDEVLLDPIRAYMAKPTLSMTYAELMQECLDAWVKAYVEDWEYCYSDAGLREHFEANEYNFLESGKVDL